MRALNSRRLQPTAILPRPFLYLLFLLFLVRDGRTRSVPDQSYKEIGQANATSKTDPNSAENLRLIFIISQNVRNRNEENPKDEGIRRLDDAVNTEDTEGYVHKIQVRQVGQVGPSTESEDGHGRDTEILEGSEKKASSPESEGSYVKEITRQDSETIDTDKAVNLDGKENAEDSESNRKTKSLIDIPNVPKKKNSTVYLNAEEKKIIEGEQKSIVDGQIQKLISIRDDVLDAQKTGKQSDINSARSKGQLEADEVTVANEDAGTNRNDKIRNRTVFPLLEEQAAKLLIKIPKFTENQLLDTLEQIVISKGINTANDSYLIANALKELALSKTELTIIECAQHLVPASERQTFLANLIGAKPGLNFRSYIMLFAVAFLSKFIRTETLVPSTARQAPILANLFDTLQGTRKKSRRTAHFELSQLVPPETMLYILLEDAAKYYPLEQSAILYLDPKNKTLNSLLSNDQLKILHVSEKLVPQLLRRQYSDEIYSCVSQFEYFSCLKYLAWPFIKQYVPSLPVFPGYYSSKGIKSLYPTYPPYRFSGFVHPDSFGEELGDLPMMRPRPEAVIKQVFQDILANQSKPFKHLSDLNETELSAYVNGIPQEQLVTIKLAELFIPTKYSTKFVNKTLECIKQYNYLLCMKYSAWDTLTEFVPDLPDLTALPDLQIPGFPELYIYYPGQDDFEIIQHIIDTDKNTALLFSEVYTQEVLQHNAMKILVNALQSIQQPWKMSTLLLHRGSSSFFITQEEIVRLAMNLVPDSIHEDMYNSTAECVALSKNFGECLKKIIWPMVAQHVPQFPSDSELSAPISPVFRVVPRKDIDLLKPIDFDTENEKVTSRVSAENKESRSKVPQQVPLISVSGTRFVPIFSEHPETVIYNILKSVQAQTLSNDKVRINFQIVQDPSRPPLVLVNLGNLQQQIVNLAYNLVPTYMKTNFSEQVAQCLKKRIFQECVSNVIWPFLQNFLPLPDIPKIVQVANVTSNSTNVSTEQNTAESNSSSTASRLWETNVRTGQQGNTVVTITDTRFYPIFIEEPETLLLNILKSVQLSLPTSAVPPASLRIEEFSKYLSEQQINIIQVAESLLPVTSRSDYIGRFSECIRNSNFLECTEKVTWPTIVQFCPWVPKLPKFRDTQSNIPNRGIELLLAEEPVSNLEVQDIQKKEEPPVQMLTLIDDIPGQIFTDTISEVKTEIVPQQSRNATPNTNLEETYKLAEPHVVFVNLNKGEPSMSNMYVMLPEENENEDKTPGTPANTPSVDTEGVVPGYPGQPEGISINLWDDMVLWHEETKTQTESKVRKRRDATELLDTYQNDDKSFNSSESSGFPNITETEYLQLLIRLKENAKFFKANLPTPKKYIVDTLNSTIRNSLTADQYEILKLVEDVGDGSSGKGIVTKVFRCLWGLSFIKCLGIFVWPMVTNGLPSLIPSFGFGERSADTEEKVQEFFGMSSNEFEKVMLVKKRAIENFLLDSYKKLIEDEFETNVDFLKIKGYGNGKVGISCAGHREGRGAKLKDNKNLPSILTIISDIMEEVLDQRPDSEKGKKDKEKKERSIDNLKEVDIQFLKDTEEYGDIKRSMNDEELILMFLNRIKSNDSEVESDKDNYFNAEDAYNAFGVLFGTKLHDQLARSLETEETISLEEFSSSDEHKDVELVLLGPREDSEKLETLHLSGEVMYEFEKESVKDQEERQRQKRAKKFVSLLDKYSKKYRKQAEENASKDIDENTIGNTEEEFENDTKSGLIIQLPSLDKVIVSRKMTDAVAHIGRAMKTKMMQMMPGFGLIMSFLLQMTLAHARAAASMAGMISNMALGSAVVGTIRDSLFGSSSEPKIKYVYDNDKSGPGITWPSHYDHYYHG